MAVQESVSYAKMVGLSCFLFFSKLFVAFLGLNQFCRVGLRFVLVL